MTIAEAPLEGLTELEQSLYGPATLSGPPGWDGEWYRRQLNHDAVRYFMAERNRPERLPGRAYRRNLCEHNPLLFVLIYLTKHVRTKRLGGAIIFSRFHLDALHWSRRWAYHGWGMGECRDGWLTARKGGKSSIFLVGLLLWALAFKHRRFALVIAHTGKMVSNHMISLREEITNNVWLRADFPELCRPRMRGGRAVMDNAGGYWADSGVMFMVMGFDQAALGIKVTTELPDLILVDDGEGHEARYSLAAKVKRLNTLRQTIFPMNEFAAVALIGTTVRHGSIMHDVARGAAWARAETIRVHHYPALEFDEYDEPRSAWPARWRLEWLLAHQLERGFALNYQCDPLAPGEGSYWSDEMFVPANPIVLANLDHRALSIDPTELANGDANDFVGLFQGAHSATHRKAICEFSIGLKPTAEDLRWRVHEAILDPRIARCPISEVLVEMNKGGRLVQQICSPLPMAHGVRPQWTEKWADEHKLSRLGRAADRFSRGEVLLAGNLGSLRTQLKAVPNGDHDDEADAMAQYLDHVLPALYV